MFDYLKEILGNNNNNYIWLILLLSFIFLSKIELNKDNLRVKFSLIYLLFFALVLFNVFDFAMLLALFFVISFVFVEFIFTDSFYRTIVKNVWFLFMDYFYKIIFEYKVFYFILSVTLISSDFINFLSIDLSIAYYLLVSLSFIILSMGLIKCNNNEFETLNFEQIYNKINDVMRFSYFGKNEKLCDFANILIHKEDRSFFKRKNSYNWISLEFILYRLNRIYIRCSYYYLSKIKYIGKIFNLIIFILVLFIEVIKLSIRFIKFIIIIFFKVILCQRNIKNYLRGYSTIEMQLIRTLSVINGYSSHVIQRKAYEFIYSKIFFTSLKDFYCYHHYNNIIQFKYYLIYLYIRTAPVKINGTRYSSILDLFEKKHVNDISIEEFFIWTLGLSHKRIDNYILNLDVVDYFDMNRSKLQKIISKFNNK